MAWIRADLARLVFIFGYVMTYLRGGFASRFINPFGDAFLLMVCVGPGLLLVGAASR
jgi:hypothetical protein